MSRLFRFFLCVVICFSVGFASSASAGPKGGGSVQVKGYTKKDGTYVPPHTRKAAGSGDGSSTASKGAKAPRYTSTPASGSVERDKDGRIARSETAKHQFEVQTGYPHGRPGYVVDHIKPLACGGADAPSNMQWQTVAEAKAKDRVERRGC